MTNHTKKPAYLTSTPPSNSQAQIPYQVCSTHSLLKPVLKGILLSCLACSVHAQATSPNTIANNPVYSPFLVEADKEVTPKSIHQDTQQGLTFCQPDLITPRPKAQFLEDNANAPIKVESDELNQLDQDRYQFVGDVVIQGRGNLILTPEVTLDQNQEKIVIPSEDSGQTALNDDGRVVYHQANMALIADNIKVNNTTEEVDLSNADYQIFPSRIYGHADQIKVENKKRQALLTQAEMTSCKSRGESGTGAKDWVIEFADVKINDETKIVRGSDAVLKFRDMPIFYLPFIEYTLEDRASGFLFPEFGSHKALTSNINTFYSKVPYFINLAPNYDATVTVMPVTKRGVMLDNEFRYLTAKEQQRHTGTVDLSFMSDKETQLNGIGYITDDGELAYSSSEDQRWRIGVDSRSIWSDSLSTEITWQQLSDQSFYSDLPIDNVLDNKSEIKQQAIARYQTDNLFAYAQLMEFKPLRSKRNLYQKRPEIGANWLAWGSLNWRLSLDSQITDFVAKNEKSTDTLNVEGQRSYFAPKLEFISQSEFSETQAEAKVNYSYYDLRPVDDRYASDTVESSQKVNVIPQFRFYNKLVFERQISAKNFFTGVESENLINASTQTIEPEVQYLYIPYRDQQMMPLFDTSARSLDFNNLFQSNRFNGVDRIGDTHQFSYAVSSRVFLANGKERMDVGLGQIYYVNQHKVTLADEAPAEQGYSDLFGKANFRWDRFALENTLQWDNDFSELKASNNRARWQYSDHSSVLMNYNRNKPEEYENIAIGGYHQINSNVQMGYFSRYEITQHRFDYSQLALGYRSCCWALQLQVQRTQLENDLYNDEFLMKFELNGLSSSSKTLEQDISEQFNY